MNYRYNLFLTDDIRGKIGKCSSFQNFATIGEAKTEASEELKKGFSFASIYDRESNERIFRLRLDPEWRPEK